MKILCLTDYSYFFDPTTSERLEKYEEGCYFRTEIDNIPRVIKSQDLIYDNKSKWLYFDLGEERYVIENPFDYMLIRAGYLVLDDYDTKFIESKEEGWKVHNELIDIIKDIVNDKFHPSSLEGDNQRLMFNVDMSGYYLKIAISTINIIVSKNQERKINNLQFYPFDKSMDKYGTIYCAIYASQKEAHRPPDSRHNISDDILQSIVSGSDRLKYVALDLKSPVFYIL